MTHFLKFIGLIGVMMLISLIPVVGMYINAAITLCAYWKLVK